MKELMLESMLNLDCGEMYVKGDTLYMPLLYSSQISAIVDDIPQPDTGWKPLAVRQGASVFAAGLSLRSLVENYAIHDPASYELARANLLKRYEIENIDTQINLQDRMLEKLVFEVMPYFVRINEDIRNRKEPTKTEILNRLAEKANIPLDEYRGKVKLVSDNTPLEKAIEQLKSLQQGLTFPNEGIITGSALEDWFKGALENHILNKEAELRENIMAIREEFLAKELDRQAVQLYLAEKSGFEIDGFGIIKNGSYGYTAYVHTGEYALVDSSGQAYLFPDCRISVSISSGTVSEAHILDKYKHPFLPEYSENQRMCILTAGKTRDSSNHKNIIKNLDDGLNATFYGYSTDRSTHHGYNPLSPLDGSSRGIRFDDYKIPPDHPKLVSGEVEIKNISITERRPHRSYF